MEWQHIQGKNKGKLQLYTLSTCGWCRKTKNLLKDLGIEYFYLDVDLLEEGDEKEKVKNEITTWNPSLSFPTLVLNNEKCIVGYKEQAIKEALI